MRGSAKRAQWQPGGGVALAVLASGCAFFQPFLPGATGSSILAEAAGGPPQITIARVAAVTSAPGTARLLGSVRVPQGVLSGGGALGSLVPLHGATVTLVGEGGSPVSGIVPVTTDASGDFTIPGVPLGVPLEVKATYATLGGITWTLRKFLLASEALACGHTDVATTIAADSLTASPSLLATDPGLDGANLFELADPTKTTALENQIRTDLASPSVVASASITPAILTSGLASDDVVPVFAALASADPSLSSILDGSFQRPDAAIGIRITALGYNDTQVVWQPTTGVIRISVADAPVGVVQMQYWLSTDPPTMISSSSVTTDWDATVDTTALPDGQHSLTTLGLDKGGGKHFIGVSYLNIENSIDAFCPPP